MQRLSNSDSIHLLRSIVHNSKYCIGPSNSLLNTVPNCFYVRDDDQLFNFNNVCVMLPYVTSDKQYH